MQEIILQNLIAGREPERSSLYSAPVSRRIQVSDRGLFEIEAGGSLNLCSFFNGLFPAHFVEQGACRNFRAVLQVDGEGQCRLMKTVGENESSLIEEKEFHAKVELEFNFSIPDEQARDVFYFEIRTKDAPARLISGRFSTMIDAFVPNVRLGVVVCTFRKEDYVLKTAAALRNSETLGDSVRVIIADNGRTLDPAQFPGATVLPNLNYGGAGGFTRGMREVLSDDTLTHILFMDDDIELEPEVVFRTVALHRVLPDNIGLSGAMLDMLQPTVMHEAGGDFGGAHYEFRARRSDLPLNEERVLRGLQEPVPFSYGAFWYFSFNKTYALKLGLLMPFFIRGDDMEYGHRLREAGVELVHQPGVSVWHEPFYAKEPVWIDYYTYRNCTFLAARYFTVSPLRSAVSLGMEVLRRLMVFRYGAAEFMLRGLQAYLKGPGVLTEKKPDELHMNLIRSSKDDPDIEWNAFSKREQAMANTRGRDKPAGRVVRLLYKLTLNGHFTFPFFTSSKIGPYDSREEHGVVIRNIAFRDAVHQVGRIPERDVVRRMNRRRCFRVLARTIGILCALVLTGKRKAALWRSEHKHLTSPEFWDEYMPII